MSTISATETVDRIVLKDGGLPQRLDDGFMDRYKKLSHEQACHLRHFHNLATQPDGFWGIMGSQEPGQEWLDAYRYQLATMAYAAGAAHYHRMPALRSVFKSLMQGLIAKMLRRDVWGYWFLTSHGGKLVDPDIVELRNPWADPIVRENIMYSGHLLLMVSLYTMLFNDDRYNEEGALSFHWNPIFWGMGPETFSYTRQSLQKAILAEMEREKWLGVCCEPNSIFIVCNQFPIIAFRYNDIRDKTSTATYVLEKYTAAWKEKGMFQDNGLVVQWYSPKQNTKRHSPDIGFTAWATTFINAWNSDLAHRTFDPQAVGFLSWVEKNRVNLNPGPVAFEIRKLAQEKNADPNSQDTIDRALDSVRQMSFDGIPKIPYAQPAFGYVAQWVSEVGDQATLDGLLNHADRYLSPTWQNGGLYYAHNNKMSDEKGNWLTVEPHTGNAAIGYARLNVFDGQRKMWEEPWGAEKVSQYPYVDGIDLGKSVDFLRGYWDDERGTMILTLRSWDGVSRGIQFKCCSLPVGQYGLYHNGNLVDKRAVDIPGGSIEISVEANGEELTVVLLRR